MLRKKATRARLKKLVEQNNALEGVFWSLKKRLEVLFYLFDQYLLLTPYKYKPFVKTFDSFEQYESWKKKQRNPWFF
jgi:hypothetical protein